MNKKKIYSKKFKKSIFPIQIKRCKYFFFWHFKYLIIVFAYHHWNFVVVVVVEFIHIRATTSTTKCFSCCIFYKVKKRKKIEFFSTRINIQEKHFQWERNLNNIFFSWNFQFKQQQRKQHEETNIFDKQTNKQTQRNREKNKQAIFKWK